MTHVILHGGYPTHSNFQNGNFYEQMVIASPGIQVRVLVVYFAKEDKDKDSKFQIEKEFFLKHASGKELDIKLASKENFISEVASSDVIYLGGGKTMKLLETMSRYPDFKRAINGKVVAGESAGANVLSKYFYSRTEEGVFEGLGIVPIRICPHYQDGSPALNELNKYPTELELVLLKDYESRVFEINTSN